jgi:hypothetical protein
MARGKEYESNAERQAAYRARHAEQQPVLQGYLAALGRTLHAELGDAVRSGESVLPAELLGKRADETLRNLIHYLRQNTERGRTDPRFNRRVRPEGEPTSSQ